MIIDKDITYLCIKDILSPWYIDSGTIGYISWFDDDVIQFNATNKGGFHSTTLRTKHFQTDEYFKIIYQKR